MLIWNYWSNINALKQNLHRLPSIFKNLQGEKRCLDGKMQDICIKANLGLVESVSYDRTKERIYF